MNNFRGASANLSQTSGVVDISSTYGDVGGPKK